MIKMVFVFGSNEAGFHGAGAAKDALRKGAVWGKGHGRFGNTYALPTKDRQIRSLKLRDVSKYVHAFLEYAREHGDEHFQVTRVGCGLAGFRDSDIAPMFVDAPTNCHFDREWEPYLPKCTSFWGSFTVTLR